MILEFLKKRFDPRNKRHENFILLHETTEDERKKNHGRLPDRFWLVLFPNAGAAKPFAIIDEWDDGRTPTDLTEDREITEDALSFWYDAQRRAGDH